MSVAQDGPSRTVVCLSPRCIITFTASLHQQQQLPRMPALHVGVLPAQNVHTSTTACSVLQVPVHGQFAVWRAGLAAQQGRHAVAGVDGAPAPRPRRAGPAESFRDSIAGRAPTLPSFYLSPISIIAASTVRSAHGSSWTPPAPARLAHSHYRPWQTLLPRAGPCTETLQQHEWHAPSVAGP